MARVLTDGSHVEADAVVIAAGAYSKPLAARLGSTVPLETERGYHVMLKAPSLAPRIPVCSGEGKYFMTPMEDGLRVAGTVELAVSAVEGIRVSEPFWIFENLDWRGSCDSHDDCEHAFHVVGRAHGTVILNNSMREFNAHVKINGEAGQWPDDGLVPAGRFRRAAPCRRPSARGSCCPGR